ncbi:MAG: hypothetical protein K8J31_21030, partial [Anaerolineae bacterium]|nr:hypothetical protein [Anaerolineae bacterium]
RNKEALKTAGLRWHRERERWYYKPNGWRKSRRSTGSLDDLARKYGYKGFETTDKEQLPARR